ncbi:MAG: UDP-N-acetylglucosamine 2-epimerase (non-hydrolyzing) [bacterium]|nr:UDP-N-acetylglucosamine 2-epimerase (non-hydrolyzing) [bacterium]
MNQRKVMVIIGTRPEAIKLAPVIRQLKRGTEKLDAIIVTTSQHREMVDSVLELFNITPTFDCDIMRPRQTLTQLTARAVTALSQIIEKDKPDLVLVQGDTTSAFAGALTAFYHHVPVGHIEAGLRSFDKYHPFPEEINRKFISVIADWHFAPTRLAKQYLQKENVSPTRIYITGNTGIDALLAVTRQEKLLAIPELKNVDWQKRIILVEAHRRENWGHPMREICSAVLQLVEQNNDIELIFPHHLNPQVYETVHSILGGKDRIHLFAATNYADFVHLMTKAYLILTDSGGIQEEAPILGKPVLLLRKVTERPEAVRAGVVKVVGTERSRIIHTMQELLDNRKAYLKMARKIALYGDGRAAERIVDLILYQFGLRNSMPKEFKEP